MDSIETFCKHYITWGSKAITVEVVIFTSRYESEDEPRNIRIKLLDRWILEREHFGKRSINEKSEFIQLHNIVHVIGFKSLVPKVALAARFWKVPYLFSIKLSLS